ncbi:MAG: hypothetical protein WDM80_14040 [Limisphaerales bacterium]
MKGFIYIAGAFHTVNRSKCGRTGAWIDNDPHFWTESEPPTWGICRNDLRRRADCGDYLFFVLPKHGRHKQMIFAYMRIAEKITHYAAFYRDDLQSKRMGAKNPNGNILVNATGSYNKRFDFGVHEKQFSRIKDEYVIGDPANSRMLDDRAIRVLEPHFLSKLSSIIGIIGSNAFDIVSRKGRQLDEYQIKCLLSWLSTA